MKIFDLAIACFSLVIILLNLVYKRLKHSLFNETFIATMVGILLSPFLFGLIKVHEWGNADMIMEMACRVTLAMALMATAFRIPKDYIFRFRSVQTVLLLLVMTGMFLSAALIIHLVMGFDWVMSLLLGAIITPTDPVLAGTIITGDKAAQLLPDRVRHTLSFESGANDGLAFPFVMLAVLMMTKPGVVLEDWITKVLLWETLGGIAVGLVIGYSLGWLLERCVERNFTAKPAILAFSLSVAFFVLTALDLLQLNSLLAVFASGIMMKRALGRQEDIEEEEVQEMMARLFTIPIFILFGLIIPWQEWLALGWKALAIPLLILLFRRLPITLLAKPLLPAMQWKDVWFVGWFGPMGVAALFYCFHTMQQLHLREIWTITSLVVFASVVVHGFTAYPLMKRYSKK